MSSGCSSSSPTKSTTHSGGTTAGGTRSGSSAPETTGGASGDGGVVQGGSIGSNTGSIGGTSSGGRPPSSGGAVEGSSDFQTGGTSAGTARSGGAGAGATASSSRSGGSATPDAGATIGTLADAGADARTGGSAGTTAGGGATATGGTTTLQWTNPIIPKRADPHVVLHTDGYYYLTATAPEYNRIEVRRATSIAGLATATVKTVWTRPSSGAMAGNIWAPEIHPIDGKWYIYFSAGVGGGAWDSIRLYVMENPSANPMEGTWTVKGQVVTKWDSYSLDASTFEHAGTRYYIWAQVEPGKTGTNIMIAKMASPTTLTGDQVILSRPTNAWETAGGVWVNEAPIALVKNNKVFIAYSAAATDANYCLGLLTANADANLLAASSWSKAAQPVFKSNDATSQYGPGHNSFTTSPDGKVDILVYHSRNYKDLTNPLGNSDRATRAQVLSWKADGTPDFSVPVADGAYRWP